MMHFKPTDRQKSDHDVENMDLARYREIFSAVEALNSVVRKAKRIADESLKQVNTIPGPQTAANSAFAAMMEKHRQDREALFSAMRRLDGVRSELRAAAAQVDTAKDEAGQTDPRRIG